MNEKKQLEEQGEGSMALSTAEIMAQIKVYLDILETIEKAMRSLYFDLKEIVD